PGSGSRRSWPTWRPGWRSPRTGLSWSPSASRTGSPPTAPRCWGWRAAWARSPTPSATRRRRRTSSWPTWSRSVSATNRGTWPSRPVCDRRSLLPALAEQADQAHDDQQRAQPDDGRRARDLPVDAQVGQLEGQGQAGHGHADQAEGHRRPGGAPGPPLLGPTGRLRPVLGRGPVLPGGVVRPVAVVLGTGVLAARGVLMRVAHGQFLSSLTLPRPTSRTSTRSGSPGPITRVSPTPRPLTGRRGTPSSSASISTPPTALLARSSTVTSS